MQYFLLATLIFSPLYVWRFNLFSLPTNFLMLWVFLVWLIFFLYLIHTKQVLSFLVHAKKLNTKVLLFIFLFFISGVMSLFVNEFSIKKLGQFFVLFLQPMSIFFIANFLFAQNAKIKDLLLNTCYLLLGLMGLYATIQYFTLWGLPPEYWGNSVEPKRTISFFTHPNFYALFSTPLLAFLIPDLLLRAKGQELRTKLPILFWMAGAMGLLLSLSRAGWLGLTSAILVYLIVAGDKKIRKIVSVIVMVIVMVMLSVPNFRYRLLLPFYGEKSANSRTELWASGWEAIKTSPILGLGLNGYANNYQKFQTDKTLDTHNFPHNILLNLWVETGVLGLLSLVGVIIFGVYKGLKKSGVILTLPQAGEESQQQRYLAKHQNETIKLGIALFLICLITQGFMDNPYFKNDLSIIFWIIMAIAI
jgi:O-antigen ligase